MKLKQQQYLNENLVFINLQFRIEKNFIEKLNWFHLKFSNRENGELGILKSDIEFLFFRQREC